MTSVRPEHPDDAPAVRGLLEAAFGRPDEADLVDALRREAGFIGLVAERDGAVVGHIAFSPMTLDARPGLRGLGLAPMAVLPEHQRAGVGSALVRGGLARCRRAGADAVFVLGHPAYYPRFGFTPAADRGLASVYDAPREAFRVLELRAGALDGATGLVRYHAAFDAL